MLADALPTALRGEPGVRWCPTAAELIVIVQDRRPTASLVDGRIDQVDAALIGSIGHACPVLVIDDPAHRNAWELAGASAVLDPQALSDGLPHVLATALSGSTPPPAPDAGAWHGGHLVVVLGASTADVAAGADELARALAHRSVEPVVLIDLTREPVLAPLHGLDPMADGLPELLAASRFGRPPGSTVDRLLHPAERGRHLILPGLRHPQGWVTIGRRSTVTALDAIRSHVDTVIALVDGDLEGETETGSFDVEDRNLLARTTVAMADIAVVVGGADLIGQIGTAQQLGRLATFGIDPGSTMVLVDTRGRIRPNRAVGAVSTYLSTQVGLKPEVLPLGAVHAHGFRRSGGRRGARAVRARLRSGTGTRTGTRSETGTGTGTGTDPETETRTAQGLADHEPERIVPGSLGHWAHDVEGWITPRAPQHP